MRIFSGTGTGRGLRHGQWLSARRGFATVGALVGTTLLLAAGALTWWLAFNASVEGRRAHASAQAELAARAGLRATPVPRWDPRSLPLGRSRLASSVAVGPGATSRVDLERMGREWFLIRAEGIHTLPSARRRIGYAAWALHPTARLGDAQAVVSSGGRVVVDAASRVRADAMNVPPPGWAVKCSPVLSAADSVVPGGTLAAVAADTTPAVRLGRLDSAWLFANADHQVSGTVNPAPVSGVGGCRTSLPTNWGDPFGSGACSNHRPLIARDGNLVVGGGVGQGILVVRGNLSFVGGAQFSGIVLVSGSVRLSEGSQVTGLLRVDGDLELYSSRIEGSSCAALLAFAHQTLAVFQPIPGGWMDPS